jgi:hypothetical protein
MRFDLDRCLAVLERTPAVLQALLADLPPDWTTGTEGPDTWSPFDVVGHLIHGELTDWVPRLTLMLSDAEDRRFEPFDRFAQFGASRDKTLGELLLEFAELRRANLDTVRTLGLTASQLDRTGIHPEFGTVTVRQLLSTWTAHDLDHIVQIARVMAVQIGDEVGPWRRYLRVVRDGIEKR